jgi:hypothetical protein
MGYVGKKPTAVPLTASDVTDGIISNAKLAQDVISAETELAVAPETTDEFLISDAGTLKRIDYSLIKSDPTHVLLSTTTVSSAIVNVDITSNIDSTYKTYMFQFINLLPYNNNVNLQLLFFTGGSIETSSIYDYSYRSITSDAATNFGNEQNAAQIDMTNAQSNNSDGGLSGRLFLNDPSNTSFDTIANWTFAYQHNGNKVSEVAGSGRIEDNTAVTGVRFKMSGGEIASGIFKLYGVN